MGKWSRYDTDEERLPEGMVRIGYDADEQVYSYRDTDGSIWEGAPGCQYGRLHRVSAAPAPRLPSVRIPDDNKDLEGKAPAYVLHDFYGDDDSDDDEKKRERFVNTFADEKAKRMIAVPPKAKLPVSRSKSSAGAAPKSRKKNEGDMTSRGSRRSGIAVEKGGFYNNKEEKEKDEGEKTRRASRRSEFADEKSAFYDEKEEVEDDENEDDDVASIPVKMEKLAGEEHRYKRFEDRQKKQDEGPKLARSGTLSRISRFLGRATGGAKEDAVNTGSGSLSRSKTTREPGTRVYGGDRAVRRPPPAGPPITRKRATTFDEILAGR